MRQFKFLGDPNAYNWDFPLSTNTTYRGSVKAMGDLTIGEIMDLPIDPHDQTFENDWKEINPKPINN